MLIWTGLESTWKDIEGQNHRDDVVVLDDPRIIIEGPFAYKTRMNNHASDLHIHGIEVAMAGNHGKVDHEDHLMLHDDENCHDKPYVA